MQALEFTGWIEKILEPGQYDTEFVVSNFNTPEMKEALKAQKDWPTSLTFKASVKSGMADQLTEFGVGDKIKVKFVLSGITGVSKKTGKYYHMNQLNVLKNGGLTMLVKKEKTPIAPATVPAGINYPADDDIPF